MKTVFTLLVVIGFFTLTSCKKESGVITMMQNPETRGQMMQQIIDDQEMFTEFVGKMKDNQRAMKMMQGNSEMNNMMMRGNGMQMMRNTMMKDTTMTREMMQSVMKNSIMMRQMMQMMHKDGMMNSDCLKTSIKMMDDKGNIKNNMNN